MNSIAKKNRGEKSPTEQRSPRKMPSQQNFGIYLAQTEDEIDMSLITSDTSESDSGEFDNINAEGGSLKKRKKRVTNPMTKRVVKIRKTFDSKIEFVDADDANSHETETLKTIPSKKLREESPNKVLQSSLFSNIETTIKDKSDDNKIKENIIHSQDTDTFEGLDDIFEEDWTYQKNTVEELDGFFDEEWSYGKETTADFSDPTRCMIIDIVWDKTDITLTVKDNAKEAIAIVKCLGLWRYTKLEPGEPVVIKAKKSSENKYWIIDNDFGWIINQPDTLISGTSVVGAIFCNRRSVLIEKFRQIETLPYNNVGNNYMLTGSLAHELLQTVLDKGYTELKQITAVYDKIVKSKHAIMMMYSAGISITDCKNLMRPAISQIYKFIQRYIIGVQPQTNDQNFDGKIEDICDIEENVWLPALGMKGKIDLTVKVSTKSKNQLISTRQHRILPLEIKTGKSSFSCEHQGQLILYTMMMNLTGRKTDSGLLLYLGENIMKEIKGSIHAQRDLITLRNTVAYYLTRQPVIIKTKDTEAILPVELPKPINHRGCTNCPYNILCCTYLSEDDKNELHEHHILKDLLRKIQDYLTQEHIDYVMKWVSLMQIEETAENEDQVTWKDIWTLKPSKREKKGSCISNLNLISVNEKCGRYFHEFQKPNDKGKVNEITAVDFIDNEYIVISTNNRINICSGYIDNITSTSIIVHCEKNITKNYNDTVFHIDKSSFSNFLMQNLSQLGGLLDNHEICSRLRKIVIERRPASFTKQLPPSITEVTEEIFNRLNEYQKEAILKSLTADDYLLIKGFPGTGKTQTLVAMIEIFVKLNKSVLVTAHTNTAIDNILLKLLDRNVDFIRLGSSSRVHHVLIDKTDDTVTANCDSPEMLHTIYSSKQVVGVTCYGTIHPHLSRRKFDICIVDESTQVLQPTILRPLYCASKFILVGDPEQLPPIAKHNVARKLGINKSLFSRLDSENNSIALTLQYRMNSCIMNIANKLTYHDRLKVGNEFIGKATLPVTNIADFKFCEQWVRKALSLRLKRSTILLNTSATYHLPLDPAFTETKGNSNYWEIAIIMKLIKVLTNLGIVTQTIGVIAPYRAQVRLLKTILPVDIEVNTVDQYQGRDKSVIIYSCSKSIPKDIQIQEFDILEDQQRLTVAVTRAKHKLIIIGDIDTLERFSPFSKLIAVLKSQENIYNLVDGKDDFCFDDLIQSLI